MAELKFNPTTPVWFYTKTSVYVPGVGSTESWAPVIVDPLYCQWKGTYGDRAVAASAQGVNDSATVRSYFHPDVYAALRTTRVVVVKNTTADVIKSGEPDLRNPNVYELWGGADNVGEAYRFMEFRVRRTEGK